MNMDTLPFPVDELRSRDGARVLLSRHGAQVCSWRDAAGVERLYCSPLAQAGPGQAIRGGVPVIFPQFAGEGSLPKHGFARTQDWQLLASTVLADGSAQAHYRLSDSPATRAIWPQRFDAQLGIRFKGGELQLSLSIDNIGGTPFQFSCALHTYLRVQDLSGLRLSGLQHLAYRDSADGLRQRWQQEAELAIVGEVDRLYYATPRELILRDGATHLSLLQEGFNDSVVWNPGAGKAAALPDMPPDDWQKMLCVEAAQVGQPVQLAPGARWQGSQTLRVLR